MAMWNEAELQSALRCGCYHCLHLFEPAQVVAWVSDEGGRTALCPRCGIDAVVAESAHTGVLDEEVLRSMYTHWFGAPKESAIGAPPEAEPLLQVGDFVRVKAGAQERAGQDGMVVHASAGDSVCLVFGYDRNNRAPEALKVTCTWLTEEWLLSELDLTTRAR